MEGVLPPAPPFLIVCSKYIPGQNVKYLCKIAKFFACQRLGRRSCQGDIEMSICLFCAKLGYTFSRRKPHFTYFYSWKEGLLDGFPMELSNMKLKPFISHNGITYFKKSRIPQFFISCLSLILPLHISVTNVVTPAGLIPIIPYYYNVMWNLQSLYNTDLLIS